MINDETVLILGAGASTPYGFPSGPALVNDICSNLRTESTPAFQLMLALGEKEDRIREFYKCLHDSSVDSIDAFLEHRPEFLEIGKSAIAQVLLPLENLSMLMRKESEIGDDNLKRLFKQRWYQHLFKKMNSTFEEFGKNKVSFVTFNYDRSLETFLITALSNLYGKTEEECAQKINEIPFIHIHGKLGHLPWQAKESIRYGGEGTTPQSIQLANKLLRIIHEEIDDGSHLEKAVSLLQAAKNIVFLGFGFHELNIKRLAQGLRGTKPGVSPRRETKIYGTAYGLESGERHAILGMFSKINSVIDLSEEDVDTLLFLRRSERI